ncbi:unnamed protein product [Ectocarpus sp. CCAP 1310/34]|nr:unnamed protein product [Ectocarpus sp. CCAP 1310/34]
MSLFLVCLRLPVDRRDLAKVYRLRIYPQLGTSCGQHG